MAGAWIRSTAVSRVGLSGVKSFSTKPQLEATRALDRIALWRQSPVLGDKTPHHTRRLRLYKNIASMLPMFCSPPALTGYLSWHRNLLARVTYWLHVRGACYDRFWS